MPLYIAQSGDLDRCHRCLTHSLTWKDSATLLLIKYKSGALVTQFKAFFVRRQIRICQKSAYTITKEFGWMWMFS